MNDWKIWALGGVGLVAAFILLKNKGGAAPSTTTPAADTTMTSSGNYTWLDGSGVEHVIATDPTGQMTNYASDSAAYDPYLYAGQLSTYNWGSSSYTNPYGGHTPSYSQAPIYQMQEQ